MPCSPKRERDPTDAPSSFKRFKAHRDAHLVAHLYAAHLHRRIRALPHEYAHVESTSQLLKLCSAVKKYFRTTPL